MSESPWSLFKPDGSPFVIAEAGVNHNGDLDLGRRLIDAAAAAGADAVKFQTWVPGELTGRFAVNVDYLERGSSGNEDRFELSRRLCLPLDDFLILQAHCREREILFLTTPDGFESLPFVVETLRVPCLKIGSTELNHLAFLEAAARTGLPIVLSTGMGTLGEVEEAVDTIRDVSEAELVVLHCTSEYPAPHDEINLRSMVTIREALQVPVGLSDHSQGPVAAICAVALGARVLEKHFTLDRSLPGPDHQTSMEPKEFRDLVTQVRNASVLLGDGRKRPSPSEAKNLSGIRRGLVVTQALDPGTVLEPGMVAAKRPFVELGPGLLEAVVGMRVNRSMKPDEPLRWDDLR